MSFTLVPAIKAAIKRASSSWLHGVPCASTQAPDCSSLMIGSVAQSSDTASPQPAGQAR